MRRVAGVGAHSGNGGRSRLVGILAAHPGASAAAALLFIAGAAAGLYLQMEGVAAPVRFAAASGGLDLWPGLIRTAVFDLMLISMCAAAAKNRALGAAAPAALLLKGAALGAAWRELVISGGTGIIKGAAVLLLPSGAMLTGLYLCFLCAWRTQDEGVRGRIAYAAVFSLFGIVAEGLCSQLAAAFLIN